MQTIARRRVLTGMGVGAAAVAFAACSGKDPTAGAGTTATTITPDGTESELGQGTFALFTQDDLNFQTLFALGESGQVAAAGEVLAVVAAASSASGGASYQSVYDAWIEMANRLEESATTALQAGHTVTARAQFTRAARYYGQALYWVFGTSSPAGEKAVYTSMNDSLDSAMELWSTPAEKVAIPYDGTSLPGWFLKPRAGDDRRPTLIINNGSDGQMVDLLGQGGFAALERGYNVLIFEGPGQGSLLFVDNVPFRSDWQNVITPVVDWLHRRSDVDTSKIALRGISFGGLLVPQAASVEHRLAAVVADPGSLQTKNNYPPVIQDVYDAGTPEQVNAEWNDVIVEGSTPMQKFNLMKTFSIFSADAHDATMKGELPSDFYSLWTEILKYDVTGVLGDITTPTLVTQYEGDTFFTTQGQQMYDDLKVARKDLVEFTSVDGTQYHCGPMNPQSGNEAMLDWLDGVLGR